MNLKAALRWAAMYRVASWMFGLVFLAFLGLAFWLGLADVVRTAVYGNPYSLLRAGTIPPVLLALFGFLLWQFGSSVAFYKTTSEAVDEQLAEQFDTELIKSDILSVLDDRLSEMQSEVEQTRREVQTSDTGGTTGGGSDFEFEE